MNVILSATLVGSGGAAAAPCDPDPAIWERTFRSVSVTEDGQPRALVPGTRIRIEFPPGGVRAGAGCGSISGSAALAGTRLTISGVNLLRNGCTDEAAYAQDAWLAAFLDRDPSVRLTGHRLVLSDEHIRFTLTDSAAVATDPPLIGTYWVIETITVNGVTTALPPFPQPYLVLQADGALVAFAGCNWISNTTQHQDGGAVLGEAGITKRTCPNENPLLETRLFTALDAGEVTLQIAAGRLYVDRPGGPSLQLRSES